MSTVKAHISPVGRQSKPDNSHATNQDILFAPYTHEHFLSPTAYHRHNDGMDDLSMLK
jgi:hypothetical protein